MKKQNGNKIMWVNYWAYRNGQSELEDPIQTVQLPNGRWEGRINIPKVNKEIACVANTQANAVINVANKASKLIDEFMEKNPSKRIRNRFKGDHYKVKTDEKGLYLGLEKDNKYREQEKRKSEKLKNDAIESVEKMITRLGKLNGSPKGLTIQVYDRSLFQKGMSENSILMKVYEGLEEKYKAEFLGMYHKITEENVIVIGFTLQK